MDWVCLLIPAIFLTGYLCLYHCRKRRKLLLAYTVFTSLICAAAAMTVVYFAGHWQNQARIAWQSISSNNNRLIVGGEYDEKAVDWSTGLSNPRLELTREPSASRISARLENRGAFIYDTKSQNT